MSQKKAKYALYFAVTEGETLTEIKIGKIKPVLSGRKIHFLLTKGHQRNAEKEKPLSVHFVEVTKKRPFEKRLYRHNAILMQISGIFPANFKNNLEELRKTP